MSSKIPKVNAKLLSKLSKKETEFAAKILETIFVKQNKVFDGLSKEEAKTVAIVIMSIPTPELKHFVFDQTSIQNQKKLFLTFPLSHKQIVFDFHQNQDFLEQAFKWLEKTDQKKVLDSLFNTRTSLFERLKSLEKEAVTYIDDIQVKTGKSLNPSYGAEKEFVLDMLQNPNIAKEAAIKKATELSSDYHVDEVETFVFDIVSEFTDLSISMRTPSEFLTHLKFYFFVDVFLETFPNLIKILDQNVNQTIEFLNELPSEEWIAKVLNQLPLSIIRQIHMTISSNNPGIEPKIRKIHTKMLTSIKNQLPSKKYKQLSFVFS